MTSPAGRRLSRWYGAGPVHLTLMVLSLALTAYAGLRWLSGDAIELLLWVAGAVVAHDLVLLPLYTLLDSVVVRTVARRLDRRRATLVVNGIRVPAVISAVLLLVWFPLILRLSAHRYQATSGTSADAFLGRWLTVTAVLFLCSATVVTARLVIRRPQVRPTTDPTSPPTPGVR